MMQRKYLSTSALALLTSVALAAADSAPANRELGFILTAFAPAIYQGKDDCPDGLAGTIRENYLDSLPADERARLLKPENEKELTRLWQASSDGPNNTNLCANPEQFDRPLVRQLQGKVARGLDLDGDSSGKVGGDACVHQNFTAPDGGQGIDNQAYRAMGCTRNYRGVDGVAGDIVRGSNMYLSSGEHSMVLLLRGVDSIVNDDDVEVIFATTGDRPTLDSRGNFITGASFTVTNNPRWRNVLHGRIVGGVLSTEPADIHLTRSWGHGGIRGAKNEWDLRRGRLRLAFQSNGALQGVFGGYQTPYGVISSTIIGGNGATKVAGIDCAAQYKTLLALVDGIRDPATGQCTHVSVGLDVAAVPAYVFDRSPATAEARRR